MTAKEIAQAAGVSTATVYKRAKQLGRLPTVEEVKNARNGRPKKYTEYKKKAYTELQSMGGHPGDGERWLRYAAVALYENGILTNIYGIHAYVYYFFDPTRTKEEKNKAIEYAWSDVPPGVMEVCAGQDAFRAVIVEDLIVHNNKLILT